MKARELNRGDGQRTVAMDTSGQKTDRSHGMSKVTFKPSRQWITELTVGDMAPNYAGCQSRVEEITCRKDDIYGKLFVHVYLRHGDNGSISENYKEGEPHLMRKGDHGH